MDLDDAAPQLDALRRCRRSRADLSIFICRLFLTNKLVRLCLVLFADAVAKTFVAPQLSLILWVLRL